MPVRRRLGRRSERLQPAEVFFLMAGQHPIDYRVRVRGWLSALELAGARDFSDMPDVAASLDDLRAEARANGFTAWAATGERPAGAGFDRWRQQFLDRHGY